MNVEDFITEAQRRHIDVARVVAERRAQLLSNLAARGVDVEVTAEGIRLTPGALRRYQLSRFSTAALIEETHKRGLTDAEGNFTEAGREALEEARR